MANNDTWPPLIVACAPNGAYKTTTDHPALPMTAAQLADTAAACLDAGAAMLHLHVRDRDGQHTLDPDIYRDVIAAIRRRVGDRLLIQATSEAAGRYAPGEQMAAIRALRPECVSLALRELVPGAAHESAAAAFTQWLAAERIIAQWILYDAADLARYHALRTRGVLPDTDCPVLFVLGRYTSGQQSDPRALMPFLDAWHDSAPWMICAFGARESACALAAAALGGHARVGFENNLQLADGSTAPHNAALIAQTVRAALGTGRSLADAAAARELLSMGLR